jgi:hypothetical protein
MAGPGKNRYAWHYQRQQKTWLSSHIDIKHHRLQNRQGNRHDDPERNQDDGKELFHFASNENDWLMPEVRTPAGRPMGLLPNNELN